MESVGSLIAQYLPKDFVLLGISSVVSLLIAIPLGILQAVRRNHLSDYILTGLSFIFYSMPVFGLAFLLIGLLSIRSSVPRRSTKT